jgi:hypothetical protein
MTAAIATRQETVLEEEETMRDAIQESFRRRWEHVDAMRTMFAGDASP